MICPDCRESVQDSNIERHKVLCASKRTPVGPRHPESRLKQGIQAYVAIRDATRPGDMIYLEGCPNILHDVDGRLKFLEHPGYPLPA